MMTSRTLLPALLSIVVLSALLSACDKPAGGPPVGFPPAPVSVITVEQRDVPVRYEYVAQTAGYREVEVRARVTGILTQRNYREGAAVTRGQSLFTIDAAPFQVALAKTETDLSVAQAEVNSLSARVNEARLNLSYTRVEAPISGIASRAAVSEGALVPGPNVLLTTATQTDPMVVIFGGL